MVAAQPVKSFLERHGAAQAKALNVIAAKLRQHGVFTGGFHPFGESFQTQPLGHGDDGGDHALLFNVLIDAGDKRAVNLEP